MMSIMATYKHIAGHERYASYSKSNKQNWKNVFKPDDTHLNEVAHNFVNLHLYPAKIFRLGQHLRYSFRDAEIILERIGNRYGLGKDALTYRLDIDGPGFTLGLIAVWDDPDQATADVIVCSATPLDEDGRAAIVTWCEETLAAHTPPRDNYTGL